MNTRRNSLAAFMMTGLAIGAATASAQDSSRVSRVTLYPGSATVERTVKVAAGSNHVELTGLSANFQRDSLRVEADAGILLGEVAVRDIARAQAIGTREAQIETRIQALEDQKSLLDVDAHTAELVRDYLKRLSSPGTERGGKEDAAAVEGKSFALLVGTLQSAGHDSFAVLQRVEAQKRDLNRQIEALKRDLSQLHSGSKDERAITIKLAAERAGELRLSYQIDGAGWRPTYRAALDSNASTVDLLRQAIIAQNTGEDWRGVGLRLSTSQPRLSPSGPEPQPWRLTVRPIVQPRPMAMSAPMPQPRAAGTMAKEARAATDAERERAEAAGMLYPVAELQSAFATEFAVPGLIDLPSDGRQITVSLARQAVAVRQITRVVPRIDPVAIVIAEGDRPEGVWLSGDVALFRDGSLVGTTRWDPQRNSKLSLPFGRDPRLRVTTTQLKDRAGDAGFLGGRSARELAYRYELTNLHERTVAVQVLDGSAISQSDQIEVKSLLDPKPATDAWDKRPGINAWELVLPASATTQIQVEYTISYPKDMLINGLP